MVEFTLDTLLAEFDESVRPKVVTALESVKGVAVYRHGATVRALALVDDPDATLEDGAELIGIYRKPLDLDRLSRTQKALQYLKANDVSPYKAAREFGLDPSAIYRALKQAGKPRCACCGQTIKLL